MARWIGIVEEDVAVVEAADGMVIGVMEEEEELVMDI
jgi:hypothetical protein